MPTLTKAAHVCDEAKVMTQFAQILKSPFWELLLSKIQGMLLSGPKHCDYSSVIECTQPSDGITESSDDNSNIDNDNVTIEEKQPIPSHKDILIMATAPVDNKYFNNSCNHW